MLVFIFLNGLSAQYKHRLYPDGWWLIHRCSGWSFPMLSGLWDFYFRLESRRTTFALMGGFSYDSSWGGIFPCRLDANVSNSLWVIGAIYAPHLLCLVVHQLPMLLELVFSIMIYAIVILFYIERSAHIYNKWIGPISQYDNRQKKLAIYCWYCI